VRLGKERGDGQLRHAKGFATVCLNGSADARNSTRGGTGMEPMRSTVRSCGDGGGIREDSH